MWALFECLKLEVCLLTIKIIYKHFSINMYLMYKIIYDEVSINSNSRFIFG